MVKVVGVMMLLMGGLGVWYVLPLLYHCVLNCPDYGAPIAVWFLLGMTTLLGVLGLTLYGMMIVVGCGVICSALKSIRQAIPLLLSVFFIKGYMGLVGIKATSRSAVASAFKDPAMLQGVRFSYYIYLALAALSFLLSCVLLVYYYFARSATCRDRARGAIS